MGTRGLIQGVMYHVIIGYFIVSLIWLPVDKATRSCSVKFFRILQVCDEYVEDDISRKRQNIISLFLRANYKQRGKCIYFMYVWFVQRTKVQCKCNILLTTYTRVFKNTREVE